MSNQGKRVEFSTDAVIQQVPTGTTEPKLDYRLTVTHADAVDSVEVEGSLDIPDYGAGGTLGLTIYPNPGSSTITLDFSGVEDEPLDIHILDYQYNRVRKECYGRGGTVDVSTLENGLYYLYTVTQDGHIISEKFCVGWH